jgi:transcriptional regulator with XRE-family HTH domain
MRELKGMSQAELARRTNLDNGTIGDFLRGERWPRSDTLASIERALDLRRGVLESIAAGEVDRPLADGMPDRDVVEVLVTEIHDQLNPALADFTDDDLVIELRRRMLYAGAQLFTLGRDSLVYRVDAEGGDALTSRPVREPLSD